MNEETGLSKSRIETLTDGIFAVVMTLLVLNISVPQISSHSADIVGTELLKRLFDLWPKILGYAISFLILAIYWSGHHRQFYYIKHSDRVLVWINIMFLMSIALLPFSTSLLGEYREQQISILVYGGNSIIIAGLLYMQWRYATSHNRLVILKFRSVYQTHVITQSTFWNNNLLNCYGNLFCICSVKCLSFYSDINSCHLAQ